MAEDCTKGSGNLAVVVRKKRRSVPAGATPRARTRRPPPPGRRYPINTRATWGLREALREAAGISGRSLAAEIEFRLELSFRDEEWINRLTEIMMASANQMMGEMDVEYERDRRWWQFWKSPRVGDGGHDSGVG